MICPTSHSTALVCRKLQFTSLLGLSQTHLCRAKSGVSWKAGRWMELSVLCQCSSLLCHQSWALQGALFPLPGHCPGASPAVCSGTCVPAAHIAVGTLIPPQGWGPQPRAWDPWLFLNAASVMWLSHCHYRKERTIFKIILSSSEGSAFSSGCFYGAPHEFLAPGGCQQHPFPEREFFLSPCREAAAPS